MPDTKSKTNNKKCESCFMPLSQDKGSSGSDKYCSYCYRDGKFTYEGDWKGFERATYEGMVANGMNKFQAKVYAWMTKFAPRWKKQ